MYLPFIVFAMTVSACLHHANLNLLACVHVLCWLTVLLEFINLYEFVPWTFLLTGSCKCIVQYTFENNRSDELILCCIMVFWLSCIYMCELMSVGFFVFFLVCFLVFFVRVVVLVCVWGRGGVHVNHAVSKCSLSWKFALLLMGISLVLLLFWFYFIFWFFDFFCGEGD